MRKIKQTGFAAAELLLVLAIVAVIGLVGYKVYNRSASNYETNSTGASQAKTQSSSLTAIPEIKDKPDLDKAESALDQNDTTGDNINDDDLLKTQANDN